MVDGVEPPSFAAGALLLGRCWGIRRWSTPRLSRSGDIADARRAVEIAEEIGSSFLLAMALEGLTWLSFDAGHCGAAALGERHLQAASQLSDRIEAHESVTVAVMCFARAGDFARAKAAATTRHRNRRSGSARTGTCARRPPRRWLRVPSGAFDELAAATARG